MLHIAYFLCLVIGGAALGTGFALAGQPVGLAASGIILIFFVLGWRFDGRFGWLGTVGFLLAVGASAIGILLANDFAYMMVGLAGFFAAWTITSIRIRTTNRVDPSFIQRTLITNLGVIVFGTLLAASARTFQIEINFWAVIALGLALILALSILFAFLRNNSQSQF